MVKTLQSLSYSVIEIVQNSQVYMSLGMLKILKWIIFNLILKKILIFNGRFYYNR